MNFKTLEIAGFMSALYGMRNPMNSWDKCDTKDCGDVDSCDKCVFALNECGYDDMECINHFNVPIIGENDMKLAKKLINAGSEHCKFLRQIQVWVNVDMPRYWWSEFDTYHFNSKNSCSTMHKLFDSKREISIDMFHYDKRDVKKMEFIVGWLNELRTGYLKTKDIEYLVRAKRLLPEGFLQLRTVNTNYAEIRNIYHQRKNHRLKEEWGGVFVEWVKSLPYSKELIMYE